MCRPVPVCRNLQTSKRCAFCRAYVAATLNFAQEQSWKARLRGRIYCVFHWLCPYTSTMRLRHFCQIAIDCTSSQNLFSSCSIGRFQHPGSLYYMPLFIHVCVQTPWRSPQLDDDSLHSAPASVSPSAGIC